MLPIPPSVALSAVKRAGWYCAYVVGAIYSATKQVKNNVLESVGSFSDFLQPVSVALVGVWMEGWGSTQSRDVLGVRYCIFDCARQSMLPHTL